MSGARTREEADAHLTRATTLVARCDAQGRAAGAGDTVRATVTIDEAGHASSAQVVDETEMTTDTQRRWRTCVVTALGRLTFDAGEAGSVELRVRWVMPGSSGADAVLAGGFHGRSSSLPSHMHAEEGPPPYPRDQVAAVVHEHASDVRHCYEHGSVHRPDLSGVLHVQFVIAADGSAGSVVVVTDDLHVPMIAECIVGRVATWTFPPPEGGQPATVTHTFRLQPH